MSKSNFNGTGFNPNNFTWWNTTAATGTANFTFITDGTASNWQPIIPDKDWMPYAYFEYDPVWHKKFASYKIQMEKMWN